MNRVISFLVSNQLGSVERPESQQCNEQNLIGTPIHNHH